MTSFSNEMFLAYAPNTADVTLTHCDLISLCSIDSCDSLNPSLNETEREKAFMMFISRTNYNKLVMDTLESLKKAVDSVDRLQNANVDSLTNKRAYDRAQHQEKLRKPIIAHSVMAVELAVLSLAAPFGGFVGLAPLAGAALSGAIGAAAGGGAGIISLYLDPMKEKEFFVTAPADFANMLEATSSRADELMRIHGQAMLDGVSDNKFNITSYMWDGKLPDYDFLKKQRNLTDAAMAKTLHRMKLNFFWNLERAYIVMADTDNCETHYAGPRSARVCLPEYPNYSFWVWHLGFLTEGMPGETPQELRGWSDLGKGSQHGGVTREDVVRSSMYVWTKFKDHEVQPEELVLSGKELLGEIQKGRILPGSISLPIAENPGGETANGQYPCIVGPRRWYSGDGQDKTKEFLQETTLFTSQDWYKFCNHHCGSQTATSSEHSDKPNPWKFDTSGLPQGVSHYKKIEGPWPHCKKLARWGYRAVRRARVRLENRFEYSDATAPVDHMVLHRARLDEGMRARNLTLGA